MATITNVTPIANEVMKPTPWEIDNVLNAMDKLYSHQVQYIKGYDTGKFELMYWDFERGHIIECAKIV